MNEQINAYLDAVCSYIKYREVHAEVRLELESHIGERVDALVAAGRPETEAVTLALRQMGDPAAVGLGLNKVHRPRTDWQLIATVVCLALVGLWVAYASVVSGSFGLPVPFFSMQLLWTALGAGVAAGCTFCDYRRLQPYGWWLVGLAFLGVFVTSTAGPATPYAGLGSPLLFVPGLAALFAHCDWERPSSSWIAALLGALPTILYLLVDQARFVPIYLVLWGLLVILARPPLRRMVPMGLGGLGSAGLLLFYIFSRPYRFERLRMWLMPWQDPLGAGYMVIQSRRMLRDAGLWGHGALYREDLLPEVHTTSAFPYLVHTLGWAAGGALCLLIALFLLRAARAAAQSRNRFGFLLVAGFLAVFTVSFVWNIGMQAGWMPLVGVDLPFISFGRQQVVQLAAVGLMLSVFRRKDVVGTAHQL